MGEQLRGARGVKALHIARHAQGTHNVQQDYRGAEQLDALLTPYGVQQCEALARQTRELTGVDLVLTSTLTRCIQTAMLGFAPHLGAGKPTLALESVRETVNFTCDRRRTIQELAAEFEWVDFSHCPNDEDSMWDEYAARFRSQDEWNQHRES